MARSSCPKCEGTTFEMVEKNDVRNSTFKVMFIQCASCGAVVGTTDYFHVPTLLNSLATKLGFKL